MAKYPLVHQRLLGEGVLWAQDVLVPDEARTGDLALVHAPGYLQKLVSGSLEAAEIRRIGVPWSAALWRRSKLAVQGTVEAARAALEDGLAGNLAGGTHHAFADHGEGFCVLNDVAVAIRVLQREGRAARALVIDLDVHQGNGTEAIFAGDADVFTFSIHGEKNFPFRKSVSSLDPGPHAVWLARNRRIRRASRRDFEAARRVVSQKPKNPPGKPAGFGAARRVVSQKPKNPPGKPAGFGAARRV